MDARIRFDCGCPCSALQCGKFFRVAEWDAAVDRGRAECPWNRDGTDDDRPGQWTATDFVDADDVRWLFARIHYR